MAMGAMTAHQKTPGRTAAAASRMRALQERPGTAKNNAANGAYGARAMIREASATVATARRDVEIGCRSRIFGSMSAAANAAALNISGSGEGVASMASDIGR